MDIRAAILGADRAPRQKLYMVDIGKGRTVPIVFEPPKERELAVIAQWREKEKARQDTHGIGQSIPADIAMNGKMVIMCAKKPELDDDGNPRQEGDRYLTAGPVFDATDLELLSSGDLGSWQGELRDALAAFINSVREDAEGN